MEPALVVLMVLIGLAFWVGLYFLVRFAMRRHAQQVQAGLPAVWEARGEAAQAYELKFRPPTGGKSPQPSMLSLRVRTQSTLELQINRETWFDRFSKAIGIAREFQTGHREFDAAWYLRGEIDTRFGMLLKQADLRERIHGLMRAGFTELQHRDGWLQADWMSFDPVAQTLPDAALTQALIEVAAAIPARSSVQAPRQMAARWGLWIFVIVLGLCFLAGVDYPPVREWDLWRLVLPLALLLWVLLCWTCAFLLRGHSRSHDRWLPLILVGLLSCTIGTRGLLGWWNGHDDPAPIVVHEAPVTKYWTSRHKSSTSYLVNVKDWKREGALLRYRLRAQEFDQVARGDRTLAVSTRSGRLRVEWELGYRVQP